MEDGSPEIAQEPRRRRRRSHRKSGKTTYQQRRRWRNIGFWLLTGLIGALIVAGIAILAGGSSSD